MSAIGDLDDHFEAGSACSEFLTPEDAQVSTPTEWGIWTVLAITGGIGFVCLLALHFCLRLADLVTKVPQ